LKEYDKNAGVDFVYPAFVLCVIACCVAHLFVRNAMQQGSWHKIEMQQVICLKRCGFKQYSTFISAAQSLRVNTWRNTFTVL